MIKVALTGNRYSGKTYISKLFKQISIPVFDADLCLKYLLSHNFEFNLRLQKNLPHYVFDKNEYLDIDKMSTGTLNSAIDVVEKELFRLFDSFCDKQANTVYVIFKSSIVFERNWHSQFKYVINVFAPQYERVQRCNTLTNKDFTKIYNLAFNELSDEEKNKSSNFVIHNYKNAPNVLDSVNKIDSCIIDTYIGSKYKNSLSVNNYNTYDSYM